MIRVVTVLVCVGLSLQSLDNEWTLFKNQFGKTYQSTKEEYLRKKIFYQNLQEINEHNVKADLGEFTFKKGIDSYSDMTIEEFKKTRLMVNMKVPESTGSMFLAPDNVNLPTTVDWRKKGYVTPVKNQQECGSCWAFSTTGVLEGQHFRKSGKLISLSEQNLVDCSMKFGNQGCGGGWPVWSYRYIKANGGLDSEASYPYKGVDQPCRFKRKSVAAKVTGFVKILHDNETDLKVATATVGPISVCLNAQGFFGYKSGVYTDKHCDPNAIDHCVLAVGYGVHRGMKYWLIKNSWGTDWGMDGYMLFRRDFHNMCGIARNASYPLV